MILKRFLQTCGWLFHFLNDFFKHKYFNFDEIQIINFFFFYGLYFSVVPETFD